jgi:hypothetical protein
MVVSWLLIASIVGAPIIIILLSLAKEEQCEASAFREVLKWREVCRRLPAADIDGCSFVFLKLLSAGIVD